METTEAAIGVRGGKLASWNAQGNIFCSYISWPL